MRCLVCVLCAVLLGVPAWAAQAGLSVAELDRLDRAILAATLDGDVLRLQPHLAPDFRATIELPTEQGYHTLNLDREQFLLYAWQARAAAHDYRVRSRPARYAIAADGRSATGTRIVDESLAWNGQPLRYTTRRTMQYSPSRDGILVTRLDVRVIDWEPPTAAGRGAPSR